MNYNSTCIVPRYIQLCPNQGLFFPRNLILHLQGFQMTIGKGILTVEDMCQRSCFSIGSSLISWISKNQSTVSRYSLEDEYRALVAATCEL